MYLEKGIEEVCALASLIGLSKDWTQGKNVQSFIGLVGKECVSRIRIFQIACLNMVKGIRRKYENII